MIEELKNILHKEQLKKDEKYKGIPSWKKEYDATCEGLGYHDLTTINPKKITEWKEIRRIDYEPEMNRQRLFWMNNSLNMLKIGIAYPFAILIMLYLIYIS